MNDATESRSEIQAAASGEGVCSTRPTFYDRLTPQMVRLPDQHFNGGTEKIRQPTARAKKAGPPGARTPDACFFGSCHTALRAARTKLLKQHPDLRRLQDQVREILETDPYNVSRRHPIKKLEGVSAGAGQYRLRLGRFRFRYDIFGRQVWLFFCGLRREDTYR